MVSAVKLFSQLTILLTFIGIPVSLFAGDQTPTGKSQALAEPSVILGAVFKVAVNPNPLYRVSYSYDFPDRSQVYIRGVGTVGSKGSLSYLYSGEIVEFFDAPGGSALYVAKLERPITLMGAATPAIPEETQFPRESRRGRWRGQGPFAEKAFSVLEQYFHSGYRAFEKDTSVFYLTTYAKVSEAQDKTRTEVSVLLSYPATSDPRDVTFTLAFITRERRSHTDWREVTSDTSQKSAETFIDKLLDALQRSEAV